MSSPPVTDRSTIASDVLAVPRRRYLLSVLYDRTSPVDLETLATDVAVREHQLPIVTEEQSEDVAVELVHNHIPRLCDLGVATEVTDGSDTRRFALADHPLLEADWVRSLLEQPRGGAACDEAVLDRTLEVLRSGRRRTLLRILSRRDDELAVADLAALFVAETRDDVRLVDLEERDWKRVQVRLVHGDLPALADAGLVDYDRSAATVSLVDDAPQWQAEWFTAGPLGDVAPSSNQADSQPQPDRADATADTDDCWTVTGREDVIARGHEIADSATDELFVAVPDAGLLQNRCLDRWRDAADRGVDVCVCSCSEAVRDIARQAIPEATICEPQFDCLNFPVDGVQPGRVVFADREQVLLVTADTDCEPAATDCEPCAAGLTATGASSPLVRFIREHVAPRLDRLEQRDEDGSDGQQSTPLPL
ncbi:hypothetical protein RBH26_02000 [Natronolimnohabitans sp. A-GB9]|uniref:DUF7344 domain-containing protein n=1 Tax=Natronolimnohabitans sp. A-GB9 TaxID=3069757 RepID=UPI0027B281AB|nr:hypothetical protein [Natronolimnohabitans sp. A-GB9]MDQ2049248.1 hypothetical protein [Natronolimnohabitans sp. A-GB9]